MGRTRLLIGLCALTASLTVFASGIAMAAGENRTATASKTTEVDPDGEPITITGEGFDPNKGIYVTLCVDEGVGHLSSPCLGGVDMSGEAGTSAWISSNPPSYGEGLATPYGPNGSFSVTLQIAAADQFVDCRDPVAAPDGCVIYMRADHTRTSDRSQDFRIPVSFSGESDDDSESDDSAGGSGTKDESNNTAGGKDDQSKDDDLAKTGVAIIGVGILAIVLIAGGAIVVVLGTRGGKGRKLTAMSAGGVVLGALLVGPAAGPVDAASLEIESGTLTWGVKESLRTHVLSPATGGEVKATGDATVLDDGRFEFRANVDGSVYDSLESARSFAFGGSVRLSGHDLGDGPLLDITIADPRLVIDSAGATLIADVTGNESAGDGSRDSAEITPGPVVRYDDVPLVDVDVTGDDLMPGQDGTLHVNEAATTLTDDGAEALAGYYEPGTALDPVSFTVQLSAVQADGAPNETSGVAPTLVVSLPGGDVEQGSDVVVSGSGYVPGRAVFVAVTPEGEAAGANPSPFAHSKRVVASADGTFTTTLEDVRPVFTNEDANVDCSVSQCHVASFGSPLQIDNRAAEQSADRSQDVFVPVTFTP